MSKTGRPPTKLLKWLEPENLTRVQGWARDGLTDAEMAEKMEITRSTLSQWKKKSEIFADTLKKGKDVADREVEDSLYKAALGYTKKIKKPIKLKTTKQKDGAKIEEERVEYVDEEIFVPGNVTAQIFWLKNRKPAEWRDKQVIESTANGMLADLIDGLKEPVEEPEKE